MVLVIDNYDSFTYNLVQYLGELVDVKVVRNDKITINEIEKLNPDHIVISPGPGRPEDAGISREVIENFKETHPILGVCLGHQCIGQVFGARIVRASTLFHGKTSSIYINELSEKFIFSDLKSPFVATRYHSLIIDPDSLPLELEILATTEDNEIMAIAHKKFPIFGLQFHPESILTDVGKRILKNFINLRS